MEAQSSDSKDIPSPPVKASQSTNQDSRSSLANLCQGKGGFAVVCETIVTVYQCSNAQSKGDIDQPDSADKAPDLEWQILDYGIPVLVRGAGGLEVSVFDVETAEVARKFAISVASQYQALGNHFHCFRSEESNHEWFALSFADVKVSSKVLLAVESILPHTTSG